MNHRLQVGGLWDEIGKLQFDFMIKQGLKPHHKLLDIGCGCLRGGIRFIEYLDEGNYYGIDKDADLLKAGKMEAKAANIGHKLFYLELDSGFEFDRLGVTFDFAIAQSVFTHLSLNEILLCLINLERVLDGVLYATFFNCRDLAAYGTTVSHLSSDNQTVNTQAFGRSTHYTFEMLDQVARWANMKVKYIGGWGHPRRQEMVAFYK